MFCAIFIFQTRSRANWLDMQRKCKLNEREQSWCKRWSLKCDFVLKKKPLEEMTEEFRRGFQETKQKRFHRAAVDYLLYTARCYFLMYIADFADKEFLFQMKQTLEAAEEYLREHSFLDEQYRAEYYYLSCIFFQISGDTEEVKEILKKASKAAGKTNEISKYKKLKAILQKIAENGDFNSKNGDFYNMIVYLS